MVEFLCVITELFSVSLIRLRRYKPKRKFVEVGVFRRGWVTFGEYFGWKETIPSIAVSHDVEMLTDDCFVLPHYTHLTDERTD